MIRVPLRRTTPLGGCCMPHPYDRRHIEPYRGEFEVPEATAEVCFSVPGKLLAMLDGYTSSELAAMWPKDEPEA